MESQQMEWETAIERLGVTEHPFPIGKSQVNGIKLYEVHEYNGVRAILGRCTPLGNSLKDSHGIANLFLIKRVQDSLIIEGMIKVTVDFVLYVQPQTFKAMVEQIIRDGKAHCQSG